ncbi:hypothetical protein Bca4012_090750 [Brassica carinata]|uniref:Uncharacterized protein n=2 Tax=Brassica TaxID=3705 RepID=A0A8X7P918_BRACI|nr:uncharacterized protein LOC106380631 [Brassica napus]KAG2246268.1 hypothetical protein Bca52824_085896 [Brassica carinata]CAF2078881.1 unnamed protein product [Brassica napus]CDY32354.1 BnaC01g36730D [Brassica napus]
MASVQYGMDQGMEIFNNELMIMSFLEEESPLDNHSSINKEEEEELNRVIRSLEVEINSSSSPPIESQENDLQQEKSGIEDDFGWLNDFDIGVVSSQNAEDMMNWCTELSYMNGVDSSALDIEGGDYYSHINYGLTFEEPTLSLWQESNDVVMY